MAGDLTTALVTGASRGIGEALVRSFRARQLEVHALALVDDDLKRVSAETGAIAHGVDIRDVAALEAAIADTPFDIVVNNAGVLPELRPFDASTPAAVDLLIDVNLRAALHVTRLVLPGMLARDRGHLFFTGSIAGRRPTANSAVYGATKAAIHAFADGLRMDVHGSSIRVTVLLPGRVQTRLYDDAFGDREQARAVLYEGVEAVQPADIAAVVEAALDLPPNVDLTAIEIVPTRQVFGGSAVAPGQRTAVR